MAKRRSPQSASSDTPSTSASAQQKVRIDKWLWAARFFKTRSLASEAVKGGKVLVAGNKVKASRDLQVGEQLTIKQGFQTRTVVIQALSERRGPASVAQTLYEETTESIANRERLQVMKQAQPGLRDRGQGRPSKKERRQIIQFTEGR